MPAPQPADCLPHLHIVGLDAVGGELLTFLETHAESSKRDGSRADLSQEIARESHRHTQPCWIGKSDTVGDRTLKTGSEQEDRCTSDNVGAPGRIRTFDLALRRRAL